MFTRSHHVGKLVVGDNSKDPLQNFSRITNGVHSDQSRRKSRMRKNKQCRLEGQTNTEEATERKPGHRVVVCVCARACVCCWSLQAIQIPAAANSGCDFLWHWPVICRPSLNTAVAARLVVSGLMLMPPWETWDALAALQNLGRETFIFRSCRHFTPLVLCRQVAMTS